MTKPPLTRKKPKRKKPIRPPVSFRERIEFKEAR